MGTRNVCNQILSILTPQPKSSPFCKRLLHNHTTPPILILESYIRARNSRRTTSGHLDFAIDLPREQRLDRKTLHHHGADDIATPSHPQSAIDFETSISTRECVAIHSDCGQFGAIWKTCVERICPPGYGMPQNML